MATPTQYNFTQQVDYPNVLVASIQVSSIVTALVNIETTGSGSTMSVTILFKDALSSDDQTTLNSILSAYVNEAPMVQTVIPKFIQQLGTDSVSICPFGTLFTAAPNQITTYDYELQNTVYLKGSVLYSSPGNIGDSVSLQIIDKNNIVGAGGSPENPTILGTFVNNWYVIPQDMNEVEDIAISNVIPQGLYIRLIYNNSSSTPSQVIVNMIAYQGVLA